MVCPLLDVNNTPCISVLFHIAKTAHGSQSLQATRGSQEGGAMSRKLLLLILIVAVSGFWMRSVSLANQRRPSQVTSDRGSFDDQIRTHSRQMLDEGRKIFRFDTFGDEAFWGDELQLHKAVAGAKLGGVGPGLAPAKALELGLKVDAEMVPPDVAAGIKAGKVDLNDPAST